MNLIDKRDKRTIYRLMRKRQYDEAIDLAPAEGLWVPLLDEGAVVDASGDVDFYIEKGVLRAFVDRIPDDFVGAIKMGHLDFASQFPILLGEWRKSDLRLVDLGGGRESLEVNIRLNEDLNIVQDLMKMPYTLAISAELHREFDEEWSERLRIPVVSSIWMENLGIVGDAGNVRSSGIDLRRT